MLRRFLLVGLFITCPFHQGSVMQVATANLFAIIYLVLQLQTMPFRNVFDDYLALGCSLSLSVLLLCSIFFDHHAFLEDAVNDLGQAAGDFVVERFEITLNGSC